MSKRKKPKHAAVLRIACTGFGHAPCAEALMVAPYCTACAAITKGGDVGR